MSKMPDAIELFKPWDPAKVGPLGYVSEKLDGVPTRIRKLGGKHVICYSRQNEVLTSIPHIQAYAARMLVDTGSLTGELYIEGMPFKQISGLVRTEKPTQDTLKLVLWLHDADLQGKPNRSYHTRMIEAETVLAKLAAALGMSPEDLPIRVIPRVVVRSVAEATAAFEAIMRGKPEAEGAVYHDMQKHYEPGKRRWTGMKMLSKPTIDIMITEVEEAVDKFGNPKGMAGGLKADLHSYEGGALVIRKCGVGPGKLKATERKQLWQAWISGKFKPRLAQVQYKTDDTYELLREATFQHWRDDKSEFDVRQRKVG